jgi:alpha-mannosidase
MLEALAMLPGVIDKHPVHKRRLAAIRRRVHRRIVPLQAEVIRSAEPITYGELDR